MFKIQYNKPFSNRKLIFIYSLIFLVFITVGFFPVLIEHFDSINKYDGAYQYLPFLAGFQENIKSIISTHDVFSSWDWSSGLGASFFDRYLYYNIGDIFSYFSIFFKAKHLPYYFTFIVFLRMYLAGLSTIIYLNFKRGTNISNVIGGLIYAFNIYLLFNTLLNPIFINALILFPLIILGIDLLLEKNKSLFLVVIAIITLISNFYFASIIALASFIYVILLYFGKYKNEISIFQYIKKFIKPVIYISILAAFFIVPLLYTVSTMSRTSDLFANGIIIYNLKYYLNILSSLFVFVDPNSNYWMLGSINLVALFSLVFVIRRRKEYKVLTLAITTSFIILLLPALTSLLAGGGSPVLRWFFIFHFISAITLVILIDNYKDINSKDGLFFGIFTIIAFVLNFIGHNFKFNNPNIGFLIIMLLILFLTLVNFRSKKNIVLTTLLFSIINMLIFLSPIGYNYFDEYYPQKGLASKMLTDYYPEEILGLTSPNEKIAFSPKSLTDLTMDSQNFSGNFSSYYDLHTIKSYNSIQNKYYFDFINNKLQLNQNKTLISPENSLHPELLRFLGVSYLILPSSNEPSNIFESKVSNIEGHTLYKSTDASSFIYSQNSIVSNTIADKLSPYEIIDVLNNSIIAESETTRTEKITKDNSINYNLILDNKIQNSDNSNYLLKKGQTYTIELTEEMNQNFYYFLELSSVSKIDYSLKESYHQSLNSESKNDLYTKALFVKDNFLAYNNQSFSLLINDGEKTNYVTSKGINGINGYSKMNAIQYRIYPEKSMTIKNNSDGDIVLENLKIKSHKKNIEPLKQNNASDLVFSGNKVTANINVDEDGMLATKIPFNKGWSLTIDGEQVPTELVNYTFVGSKIKQGNHSIVLEFQQYGLKVGLLISLIGAVLIIIMESSIYFIRKKNTK